MFLFLAEGGMLYRVLHTDLFNEGGPRNNLAKACEELEKMEKTSGAKMVIVDSGKTKGKAKMVIVDSDYGHSKAEWDDVPWTRGQFDKAVEVKSPSAFVQWAV